MRNPPWVSRILGQGPAPAPAVRRRKNLRSASFRDYAMEEAAPALNIKAKMRPDGLLEPFLCHPERSEETRLLPPPLFHGTCHEHTAARRLSVGRRGCSGWCPRSFFVSSRAQRRIPVLCLALTGRGRRRASGEGPNSKFFPHPSSPSSRPKRRDPGSYLARARMSRSARRSRFT